MTRLASVKKPKLNVYAHTIAGFLSLFSLLSKWDVRDYVRYLGEYSKHREICGRATTIAIDD